MTATLVYSTTLQLGNMLGIVNKVPSWDAGATPSNEYLGTGANSATDYYLDNQNIVADTYSIYYGDSATASDTLTETTHYSLTTDSAKVVLNDAGIVAASGSNIYASYKYFNNGMTNDYIAAVLERAEKRVNELTNSRFTDSSGNNPSYPSVTEIQPSEGLFQDRYIVNNKPLIDISSTLDGDITAAATSIDLASGTGADFPSSGKIIIGSEVISYTGITTDQLTGCSRAQEGTTAAAHSDGDSVHTTILFRSDTSEGTSVSWTVQPWDTSMYATSDGLFYKFKDASPDQLSRQGVASRIKMIYYHGYDEVPVDITRLTLLLAKQMLIKDTIGKSIIAGRNEFKPGLEDVDQQEIDSIIGSYIVLPMGNT